MKYFSFFLLLIIFSLYGKAQEQPSIIVDKSGSVHPWSNLKVNNDPRNFQFAIVTDRTGGHREGVFEDAIGKLNLLQPEFVMSVGDLIEGYTRNKEKIYNEWDEFNGFISKLQMPFFYVPGNHDYINDVMADIWKEKYGRSYYHFVYKDVLFLCMNSEEATMGSNFGGIEKPQYEYFKKVIEENKQVKWTLLFMHQPLWILDNTRYWKQTEALLQGRDYTVFAGHHHHYVKYIRNNQKYFLLATTGGASRLRGSDFGEFDHFVWVTMSDKGPIIANLFLEGIWDEDVVNEEITSMIVANPLKVDAMIISNDIFSSGSASLKITNDANIPLTYSLEIVSPENINVRCDQLTGSVQPNNVYEQKLIMNAESQVPLNEIVPVSINLSYEYTLNTGRTIKSFQSMKIAPVNYYPIQQAAKAKSIDGVLKDWGNLSFDINEKNYLSGDSEEYFGNEDASLRFAVEYDDDFLYIAAWVKDDEVFLDEESSTWQQDALRVYLDGRPVHQSAAGKEEREFVDFTGFFFSPGKTKKDALIAYQKDKYPDGTKMAARYSDQELFFELAVPIAFLDQRYGSSWKNFRLNIAYNDVDFNASTVKLWWKPEWRSENNYLGSGLFKK